MTMALKRLRIAAALALVAACTKPKVPPAPPASPAVPGEVMGLLYQPTSAGPMPGLLLQSSLPETFPRVLIPGGAEIAAIATRGTTTVVVARIPSRVSFFWPHHEWRLQDAGWTLSGLPAAGFMSSTISVPPSTTLCRSGEFAVLTYRTSTEGDRLVRIVSGPEPDRSCRPLATPFSDLPLPRFELPDSVRIRQGSGVSGRADATSSRARLETSMSTQSLAELCVPQMIAAGWILERGAMAERGLSVTRLRANTRTGDPVTAHLIFAVLEPEVSVLALLYAARDRPSTPIRLPPLTTPDEGTDLADTTRRLVREGLGREDASALSEQGAVPEGFPRELLFPGSEVTVVAASPTTSVVVSRVAAGAPFDPARFEWSLEDRGWTGMMALRFGFSQAFAAEPGFCRGSEFASWIYRTLPTGDHLLRASVTTAPQRRACAPPPTRALADIAIPRLELSVAGVRGLGAGGSSGSTNDASSSTRLQTDIATEAVLSALVPQMRAVGWTEQERIAGLPTTSVARLVSESRKGQPVTALLFFAATGPYVDALLLVARNTPELPGGR